MAYLVKDTIFRKFAKIMFIRLQKMNVILALGCTAKENTGKDQESRRTARKYSALWLQKQPIVLSFCRKFFEKTKLLNFTKVFRPPSLCQSGQ